MSDDVPDNPTVVDDENELFNGDEMVDVGFVVSRIIVSDTCEDIFPAASLNCASTVFVPSPDGIVTGDDVENAMYGSVSSVPSVDSLI